MKKFFKKYKYELLLMAFTICILIYTVFGRAEQISENRLDLFWSYREVFVNNNIILLRYIFLNIALFIPIGYILACGLEGKKCTNKLGIFFSFGYGIVLSVIIEFCQYYLFKGTAEIDDIFNNTIGAIIGYLIFVGMGKTKIRNLNIHKLDLPIAICCVCIAAIACIIMDNTSDSIVRQLAFQASNIKETNGKLVIDGFCFTYGYDLIDKEAKTIDVFWDDDDYDIFLKSTRTGKKCSMDTETNIGRPEVNEYFKSAYEYPRTGYEAKIDINKIDPKDEYEIMIKSGRLEISGKTYIKGGEIEKTPQSEQVSLNVKGANLKKIVSEGYLKAHNKDNSCVVYQYGKNLFWIADDTFTFNANGLTRIEYQIWTTQLDKIPGYKSGNDMYWDNQSFIFEEKEITNQIDCGKFRVAMMKLPMEYSIAFITTGLFRNGFWEWMTNFRPRY